MVLQASEGHNAAATAANCSRVNLSTSGTESRTLVRKKASVGASGGEEEEDEEDDDDGASRALRRSTSARMRSTLRRTADRPLRDSSSTSCRERERETNR